MLSGSEPVASSQCVGEAEEAEIGERKIEFLGF